MPYISSCPNVTNHFWDSVTYDGAERVLWTNPITAPPYSTSVRILAYVNGNYSQVLAAIGTAPNDAKAGYISIRPQAHIIFNCAIKMQTIHWALYRHLN